MSANALVQTRINGEVKREAAEVLGHYGLTVSDAVRLLLTRVAREKTVPSDLLMPNRETIEAMEDARAGRVERVASIDELFKSLNAND